MYVDVVLKTNIIEFQRLREVFGDSKRLVDKEDLCRMRYCDAIINEILRLYPPLPFVMRYADKELRLSM